MIVDGYCRVYQIVGGHKSLSKVCPPFQIPVLFLFDRTHSIVDGYCRVYQIVGGHKSLSK